MYNNKNGNFNNNKKVVKKRELKAECKEMCPQTEITMRIKNKLVNTLEKVYSTNAKFEYKLVKEYSRPAADKYIKNEELRTIETLVNTTHYLIEQVYRRKDVDYLHKYDFIFDRLRAVRQDLIIQRCHDENSIHILELVLCFYLLADYKLCASKNYDEYINFQHVSEVLSLILTNDNCSKKNWFNSLFILLNLNNFHQLTNTIKNSDKNEYPLNECVKLAKAYLCRDYVRLFRIYRKLPLVCKLALHRRIPLIENDMIKVMGSAFSFKNVRYPVDNLLKISVLNDERALDRFVEANVISIDVDHIVFNKVLPNVSIKNERSYLDLIDNEINDIDEVDFILGDAFILA